MDCYKTGPVLQTVLRTILPLLLILLSSLSYSQWVSQESDTDNDIYSIHFFDANTGIMGTASSLWNLSVFRGGEIVRTTNGGENWTKVLTDSNFRFKNFYFTDENTGYAVGGSYAVLGFLYKTIDKGLSWTDVSPGYLFAHFYSMIFFGSNTGYIGAFDGVVKTVNGGINWEYVLRDNTVIEILSWKKIFFTDVNTGYYLADSAKVYKTVNGGVNWTLKHLSVFRTMRDIKFTNQNTGFITGDNGLLFRTTDAGDNWNQINTGITNNLYSVTFPDLVTGYIASQGFVLKSTNSGENWFQVLDNAADTLFAISFLNPNHGFTAGKQGRVYVTATGGVLGIPQITGEVPDKFFLHQNYPNPFNPSTNIKFAVTSTGIVKLAVYDMLGRELEMLVSEQLSPATYEVKWDASKYSSGIYFYRITAGSFGDVKKMTLIK